MSLETILFEMVRTYIKFLSFGSWPSRLNILKPMLTKKFILFLRSNLIKTYDAHAQALFNNFKILNFEQHKKYNLGTLQWQIEHKSLPTALQKLFTSQKCSTRIITLSGKFHPLTRTSYKRSFVTSTGTLLWKELPANIKSTKNVKLFQKSFKKYILSP